MAIERVYWPIGERAAGKMEVRSYCFAGNFIIVQVPCQVDNGALGVVRLDVMASYAVAKHFVDVPDTRRYCQFRSTLSAVNSQDNYKFSFLFSFHGGNRYTPEYRSLYQKFGKIHC